MEHHVAGQRVAVCLGASLRVEHLRDVAQVAEDVESVEGKGEAELGYGLADACVPHEVVGVGACVGVASVAVEGEVADELHVPG